MFRSIALSALTALTLASAPMPSMAQTGAPGVSGGSVSSDECGRACREERRANRPGVIAGGQPEQRVPPGYYRPDPRDRPGRPGRPRPPEDPGYYRPDPPRPRPPHYRPPIYVDPGYYRPPVYEGRYRLSCREARQIVRSEGFRDVRAVDCEGRTYQFEARRRGRPVLVVVSSRSGEILDVSRL